MVGCGGGDFLNDIIAGKRMENNENNKNLTNDEIKHLAGFRTKTGRYTDIPDKDLLDLILYAVEEIKMFNDLGNNAANMNTLPKKLYVYRNRCNNLIKDVKNIFFLNKKNNNN